MSATTPVYVDREILVVPNTSTQKFSGPVILDRDIHATPGQMRVVYSNQGTTGTGTVHHIQNAKFHRDGQLSTGPAAALDVILAAREVQVLVPF